MSEVELLPCPCCGKSDFDIWPNETIDRSGTNVVRCAWCHCSAPMANWNRRESAIASRPAIEQEAARYRFLRDQADSAQIAAFVARRRTRLAADRVCDSGIEIAAVLIEGETK